MFLQFIAVTVLIFGVGVMGNEHVTKDFHQDGFNKTITKVWNTKEKVDYTRMND